MTSEKSAKSRNETYIVKVDFWDEEANGTLRKAGHVFDVSGLTKKRIGDLLQKDVIEEMRD